MGRKKDKYKTRVIPEQNKGICGTICLCQMIMVLSCVSFVYLSVAIYIPAHKAFNIGMNPTPVMCRTVDSSLSKNCSWASCGEWCLTKTSGFCPQIHVDVRQNGTDVIFYNCTRMNTVSCPPAKENELKRYNCNNPSECVNLTGIFNCHLGHCANLSEIYYCRHETPAEVIINSETDNLKLNGLFDCVKARCILIESNLKCDRYCAKITTATMNVYLKYDDNVFIADCNQAVAVNEAQGNDPYKKINETEFWTEEKNDGVLFGICTDVVKNGSNSFKAWDCVNGTVVKNNLIPPTYMNFTQYWGIYDKSTIKVDPSNKFMPVPQNLTIYNKSRLYINLEACVNTLRDECKEFYEIYGQNGSENTAASQFPCYYNYKDSAYAVTRFNLDNTWMELMIAVCVPGALFVVSFVTLLIITQTVRVGDDARMRCDKLCYDTDPTRNQIYEAVDECDDKLHTREELVDDYEYEEAKFDEHQSKEHINSNSNTLPM